LSGHIINTNGFCKSRHGVILVRLILIQPLYQQLRRAESISLLFASLHILAGCSFSFRNQIQLSLCLCFSSFSMNDESL
ncbi:hypothetical protein D0Y65_010594, partial [Glycine soja]